MIIAGGHVCGIGANGGVLLRLDHREPALRVQPFGKTAGKSPRHVLHNQHRRFLSGGQLGQQFGQSPRPAG